MRIMICLLKCTAAVTSFTSSARERSVVLAVLLLPSQTRAGAAVWGLHKHRLQTKTLFLPPAHTQSMSPLPNQQFSNFKEKLELWEITVNVRLGSLLGCWQWREVSPVHTTRKEQRRVWTLQNITPQNVFQLSSLFNIVNFCLINHKI